MNAGMFSRVWAAAGSLARPGAAGSCDHGDLLAGFGREVSVTRRRTALSGKGRPLLARPSDRALVGGGNVIPAFIARLDRVLVFAGQLLLVHALDRRLVDQRLVRCPRMIL